MRSASPAAPRIGTSGFVYASWKRRFYPAGLPPQAWLSHYARHFDTVEINSSFYRLPDATVFARWRDATPPGFVFAVKFSRFGTHMKRLLTPRATIRQFLARAGRLGSRLGPVLVQLPPRWAPDLPRLDAFRAAAPRDVRWVVEVRGARRLRATCAGWSRCATHAGSAMRSTSCCTGIARRSACTTSSRRIRGW